MEDNVRANQEKRELEKVLNESASEKKDFCGNLSFKCDVSLKIALDRMSKKIESSRSDLIRKACWQYLLQILRGGQTQLNLNTRQQVIEGVLRDMER